MAKLRNKEPARSVAEVAADIAATLRQVKFGKMGITKGPLPEVSVEITTEIVPCSGTPVTVISLIGLHKDMLLVNHLMKYKRFKVVSTDDWYKVISEPNVVSAMSDFYTQFREVVDNSELQKELWQDPREWVMGRICQRVYHDFLPEQGSLWKLVHLTKVTDITQIYREAINWAMSDPTGECPDPRDFVNTAFDHGELRYEIARDQTMFVLVSAIRSILQSCSKATNHCVSDHEFTKEFHRLVDEAEAGRLVAPKASHRHLYYPVEAAQWLHKPLTQNLLTQTWVHQTI